MRAKWLGFVGGCALLGFLACGDDGGDEGGGGGATSADGGSSSGASSGGPGGGGSDGGGGPDGRATGDGGPGDDGATGETCGVAAAATGFVGAQSIVVGGVTRTYQLFVPPGYDQKARWPVVLVFHGDGGSGAGVRGSFDLETVSGGNAIIAYPDGQGGTWQIDAYAALMKDVAFVDALVGELQASYCGDGRSFLVGFSKGAYFANQAACRSTAGLTGVASHSGGGPYGTKASEYDMNGKTVCPSPAVPALQIHGTADGTVPLSEGVTSRDYWRGADACGAGTTARAPSPCVGYNGCARAEVWCQVSGLGHTVWSQAPTAIWDFFASL